MKSSKISTEKNNDMADRLYIPERFEKEIKLHVLKNYCANKYHEFETPLILAVSGPPGTGKTYQVQKVLERIGIKRFDISGAEFENEHAGIPAKEILKIYKEAAEDLYYNKNKMEGFSVIVINDIDAALGNWGGLVQYTMNRQLVLKTLIDLADNPYKLRTTDEDGNMQCFEAGRIPLIITLNDETKMYEPLMRNGRTKVFSWIPNEEEILNIINSIFKNIKFSVSSKTIISQNELYIQLLDYARKEIDENIRVLPISLFSDIRSSLMDDYLWHELCGNNSPDIIAEGLKRKLSSMSVYEFSDVLKVGKSLLHRDNNYLNKSKYYEKGNI